MLKLNSEQSDLRDKIYVYYAVISMFFVCLHVFFNKQDSSSTQRYIEHLQRTASLISSANKLASQGKSADENTIPLSEQLSPELLVKFKTEVGFMMSDEMKHMRSRYPACFADDYLSMSTTPKEFFVNYRLWKGCHHSAANRELIEIVVEKIAYSSLFIWFLVVLFAFGQDVRTWGSKR